MLVNLKLRKNEPIPQNPETTKTKPSLNRPSEQP